MAVPVALKLTDDRASISLPDAEAEPVPEADVALGDASGQLFVPTNVRCSSSGDCGVTLSDFDRIKVLGKGSFGKVLLVEKVDTGTRYAMKVLKKNKLRRQKQIERTKTERSVLEICDHHPFIMSMYYAFQVTGPLLPTGLC